MRTPSLVLLLLAFASPVAGACSDKDGTGPVHVDAALPDVDIFSSPAGPYHRVVPAYDTEANCRAQNPDPLFHCIERIDLCDDVDRRAYALFTDIVTDGTWAPWNAQPRVTIQIESTPQLTQDGSVELEIRGDGSLFSPEVYGDRAFVRGGERLCPST